MSTLPDPEAFNDAFDQWESRQVDASPTGDVPSPLSWYEEAAWARAMIAVNTQGRAATDVVAEAAALAGRPRLPWLGGRWHECPFLPLMWVWQTDDGWTLGSQDTFVALRISGQDAATTYHSPGLWELTKKGRRRRR